MSRRAVIAGTGRFVGEAFTPEEILRRNGIDPAAIADEQLRLEVQGAYKLRRKIYDPEFSTSTIFIEAGKRALTSAGLEAKDVSLLICVTDTPDFMTPATASRVQLGLGAVNAGFFDLNSACSGFSIGLSMASNFIRCNEESGAVLVIGGNFYSRVLAPTDISGQLLFSDGAGAVVLKPMETDKYGLLQSQMHGDGQYWNYWGIFGGGTWKGTSEETLKAGMHYLTKNQSYGDINVRKWPPVIKEVLRKTGWTAQDVEIAFFTQSRPKTMPEVCKHFGWETSISYDTGHCYGYIGSACVPVALDDAREHGRLKDGQKVLILTSGVGYSSCAVTLVWGGAGI